MNALKKCKDKVVLLVAKAEIAYTSSPTMGQIPPLSAGHFSLPNRYNAHKLQMFIALFFLATHIISKYNVCTERGVLSIAISRKVLKIMVWEVPPADWLII